MLSLTIDRLDYGQELRPPEGYTLDLGIATSYSLDLEALVATSLALSLDQTLEGDLKGEGVAFLEALDLLRDRLLVFYHVGALKVPASHNQLFTLLEPILAPASPGKTAFSSFHPKAWVLRFAAADGVSPQKFRLLVLSRNLSFDRSWDVACCIDGQAGRRRGNANGELVRFLRSLPSTRKQSKTIENMCESLSLVEWETPDRFSDLRILPGLAARASDKGSVPLELEGPLDELLVVSPFVDADSASMLQALGARTRGCRSLISRADTLDAIGDEALRGWSVMALPDDVVDGEERQHKPAPKTQDLHAKLVVAKVGSKAIWHIGSANMTNAALGSPEKQTMPRNTELMVRLEGADRHAGPAKLLQQWTAVGALVPHLFSKTIAAGPDRDPALRQLMHDLARASWLLHATAMANGLLEVELRISPVAVKEGFRVHVGLLCAPVERHLAASLKWDGLKLADLSAFVTVHIQKAEPATSARFAIQATFTADMMEVRRKAVFKATVGTPEKLVRYLTLLLDTDASKDGWLRAGEGGAHIFGLNGTGALYEQLLRAASRSPSRLKRAMQVLERLQDEEELLPAGLHELFAAFAGDFA